MKNNPFYSEPTKEQINYYMSEACPYFALALHKIFNYPIAILQDNTQIETWGESNDKKLPLLAHVFCFKDNSIIDVRGITTTEDLFKIFYDLEEPEIDWKVSQKELIGYMGPYEPFNSYDDEEINEAIDIIKGNLNKYTVCDSFFS